MAKKGKKDNKESDFPQYCDYFCKYASFSDPNTIGACRKELAVWCVHFKRYNNKNNVCFGRQEVKQ